jgi:two-component system heavy metal sensor histidine kinase CusS
MSRMSLTRRLTLMFVATATSVLLALGLVVAKSAEQHFEDLDMLELSGKMELIQQGLIGVTSVDQLTSFTHQLAWSLVGHHGLEVMMLDTDRAVMFATSHANFPPSQVLALATQTSGRPALWQQGNQTYRVIAARLPTGTRDGAGQVLNLVVLTATDIGHHQTYMRDFLKTLWLFVACAAVGMALLGWALVRRGLAPLHAMREQAQVVTAQQLSHRLPVHSMPVELAQLAQSLNDMLARLEVAFARLSDFSSDIAHELRTPVSNLMTQTQVVLSHPRDAAEYKATLESNAEELDRMARMIADMLLLAKSDNGLVLPNRETVDLADETQALFDYYDALASDKGLQLSLVGKAQVLADQLMLRRAIGNLISNAVRHATPGSRLLVTLEDSPEAAALSVENSGRTIPAEYLDRVFDRFFRVDAARQRSEGTGLGLAIAKSIVSAHGGTISVSSSESLTRFSIRLPHSATLRQTHPHSPAQLSSDAGFA